MDIIDRLKTFVRVAESGSFSATASEFGLGQPAVSRAVSALERRLGVTLMHRNTRGLSLTEDGARVYEQSLSVLERFDELQGRASSKAGHRRRVRIACPMAFGTLRLIKLLAPFSRSHPDLELDLRLSDAFVDLVEDGVDVAFRFGALSDSNLTARKLGELPRIVVASVEYLRRHGTPRRLEELSQHQCVVRGRTPQDSAWAFPGKTVKISGVLKVDNFLALREAVLSGAGIAMGGTVTFYEGARLHPKLRQLFVSHTLAPLPVNLVFQRDRFLPTRVRTFIDHFADVVGREPWLARPVGREG